MQESVVYGSVILAATTPVKPFAIFNEPFTLNGAHTESRFKGLYSLLLSGLDKIEGTIALPQRNKYFTTQTIAGSTLNSRLVTAILKRGLEEIDAKFEGARHLYRLNKLMEEIHSLFDEPYVSVINNQSDHSYFVVLANRREIFVTGCYDTVNKSVRLMFSTDNSWIQSIRSAEPTRYVFYRYPNISGSPLFLHTQSLCSRWYSWTNTFTETDGVLKAFNALETVLYKDPNLDVLPLKRKINGRD
jgi:hypothetical protein